MDDHNQDALPAVPAHPAKPTHYKIVCYSLYTEDLARVDRLLAARRLRGDRRACKSQVVREALLLLERRAQLVLRLRAALGAVTKGERDPAAHLEEALCLLGAHPQPPPEAASSDNEQEGAA